MKLLYPLPIKNDFVFTSTSRDFIVEEIPLYPFSGKGEHLVLKVRKKELTTWDMIAIIAKYLGINRQDIGYAGLKDKHAMTLQYISIPAKFESQINNFLHDSIKILEISKHANKIKIGHLKGNRFEMRLKKVLGVQKEKLDSGLNWIEKNGLPNYFGVQRFGTEGNNWEDGKKIIAKKLKIGDKKLREFLVGSYQSYLFNQWLSKRIEISLLLSQYTQQECEAIMQLPFDTLKGTKKQSQFFKILHGDVMMHYPHGRLFEAEDILQESQRFNARDISPTGLLAGIKTTYANSGARVIEEEFKENIPLQGSRRYGWIWATDITKKYIPEKAHYELGFVLPKGCYATNVLDLLRGGRQN
ncbi:MAG TPA: tRNA pseudouridine(13) synthase TruD [Epsilonproteobacteria bacterium]|nr:tRNA pseudouridine(13) synthase TruD [Campylobacterota bacterium]